MKAPCVYIAKDVDGVVLYIGMTLNFRSRIDAHGKSSAWFEKCKTVEIVHCESRRIAFDMEKSLILKFKPSFNVAYLVPPEKRKISCAFVKKRMAYEIFRSHVSSAVARSGGNVLDERIKSIMDGKSPYRMMRDDYSYACKSMCLPLASEEYYGLFK